MSKTIPRNPFVALCEYASQNNWCWKLFCTTCGHGAFRVSFSKLIHDQHPDNDSFWPHGKIISDVLKELNTYNDFWRRAIISNQLKLASIVADAKISDIRAVAKFPDWLGYIGLVIDHCPSRNARKLISDAFIPQFIEMIMENTELSDYLKQVQSDDGIISINDLSKLESGIVDLDKPSVPLIFDVL